MSSRDLPLGPSRLSYLPLKVVEHLGPWVKQTVSRLNCQSSLYCLPSTHSPTCRCYFVPPTFSSCALFSPSVPQSTACLSHQVLYTPLPSNVFLTYLSLRAMARGVFFNDARPLLLVGTPGSGKTLASKVILSSLRATIGSGSNAGGIPAYTGADGLAADRWVSTLCVHVRFVLYKCAF